MKDLGLGEYRSINAFVEAKLRAFSAQGVSFLTLFSLMFQERENVLYERSEGYRIVSTTYGQAHDAILRRAAVLASRLGDLPENAVVGLSMENSLEWIENFWAILLAGFRPLLVNLRLPEEALRTAFQDADARAVISDGRSYDVLTVFDADLAQDAAPIVPEKCAAEILVMSSGTSRHVKLCAYTAQEFYRQIADSRQMIRQCALTKRHYHGRLKLLAFLPFYHVFGLIAMYLWFGFFSRTFVHLQDLAPQTILTTIRRHNVTHIFAVPLFWETVYDEAMKTVRSRGEKTGKKLQRGLKIAAALQAVPPLGRLFSRAAFREVRENLFGESVQFTITGGSAIRPEVLTFFNAIGYRLADGYGMSEIGIASVELSGRRKWQGFVGKPLSSAEYRIEDGELLVRSAAAASYVIEDGFRRDRDGWFPTRDLAEAVSGHYRIQGRKDDLIVAPSGENLNPVLVESALAGVSGVSGLCLIGAAPSGKTVPVLLASVGRYQTEARMKTIDSALRARLQTSGLSGQIGQIFYTASPLLSSEDFKLDRLRLKDDFEAGRLIAVTPAAGDMGPADALYRQVVSLFALAADRDAGEIGPDSDFFLDCGGTSLDYFALTARLQTEFSVPFPADAGTGRSTPRALYDYVKAAMDHGD